MIYENVLLNIWERQKPRWQMYKSKWKDYCEMKWVISMKLFSQVQCKKNVFFNILDYVEFLIFGNAILLQ